MKKLFLLSIIIVSTSFFLPFHVSKDYTGNIIDIKETIENSSYNTNYTILVDYSIPSGKNRLFLYNLYTEEIEKSFLVAHGDGCPNTTFSNEVGSNCSSEGMSVINGRDYSNWGINVKYWVDGLDHTNSNLRKRVVVLHSWWGIPNIEIYPFPIVESQGCFTVSNNTMRYLDKFIQKQENKKILIYSFK
jgi:hypothetical protein